METEPKPPAWKALSAAMDEMGLQKVKAADWNATALALTRADVLILLGTIVEAKAAPLTARRLSQEILLEMVQLWSQPAPEPSAT